MSLVDNASLYDNVREPITSDSPTSGNSAIAVDKIRLEEIMPYFEDEYIEDDPVIQQAILNNRKRTFTVRINQLNKILSQLVKLWEAPSPLHYYIAFLKKDMNPDELLLTIEDVDFQKEVNKEVKSRTSAARRPRTRSARKQLQKEITKKALEEAKNTKKDEDSDDDESSDDGDYYGTYATGETSNRGSRGNVKRACKPQKLNIPCPPEVKEEEWNTWSDAHKQSYKQMKSNPNSYLYRNLSPGEKQKNGPWSPEEHRLFLKRLHEIREQGINEGKWGIFSEAIPGRVGYQCANYYRKLVKSGEVHDEYYRQDEDGNLHFKDRQSYHKGTGNKEDSEDNSDSEEESAPETKVIGFYEKMAQKNPIKNKQDFITGETIQVPAISPDGTVLDYNTWLHLLTTTKQDPFTLRKINKRLITIITTENYNEFKNKIKHI